MAGTIVVLGSSFVAHLKEDAQTHVDAMEEDIGIHDHRIIVKGRYCAGIYSVDKLFGNS